MLHVITVHWYDERWIKIQADYFRENLGSEFVSYAFLNGIDKKYHEYFDVVLTEDIECCKESVNHAVKLNILAQVACNSASDEDILIFIDGDAIPVVNISDFLSEKLAAYDLLAVQRLENRGDIQPHPLFCAIPVKTWKKIDGDWNRGYRWKNIHGKMVTDTGGNLLKLVEDHNLSWFPLHRTNKKNHHPVFFGLYSDVVYHHGAAFRPKFTRQDRDLLETQGSRLHRLYSKLRRKRNSGMGKIFYTLMSPIFSLGAKDERKRLKKQLEAQNQKLSDEIFEKILQDKNFYLDL